MMRRKFVLSSAASTVALFSLVHCGDPETTSFNGPRQADPCTTVLSGKCGATCASDDDCAAGLHCGSEKQCKAECSTGATLCGTAACTDRGRCNYSSGSGGSSPIILNPDSGTDNPDSGTGGGSACADINLDLSDVVPTVALLIDRSGSMDDYKLDGASADNDDSSSPLRWDALRDGLLGADSAIKKLESKVRFGFVFYSEQNTPKTCPDLDWGSELSVAPPADATLWPPALNKFAAFESYFKDLGLIDNTPTAESVKATADALNAFTEPGPKFIVLATDGDPDRCGANNAHDDTSRNGSVAAVKAAKDEQGIGTFVIGIGKGAVTLDHLQDLANVGAGMPREDRPGAKYYEVGTQTELAGAFNEIIAGVRTCDFALNGEIDPALASQGSVVLDGKEVPFNADNGWKVLNSKTIELTGEFCAAVKSPGNHVLSARFPCNVVVEPPK